MDDLKLEYLFHARKSGKTAAYEAMMKASKEAGQHHHYIGPDSFVCTAKEPCKPQIHRERD
jgi:hypothetical protein